jgi:hypothetical protein
MPFDPVAAALANGQIAAHEVDLARRLVQVEADESGDDPGDTIVAAYLNDLPVVARPVAASGRADADANSAYQELFGDLDREIDRLTPPDQRAGHSTPQPVAAAAGPWGYGDPISWGIATGRLMPADRPQWTANFANDPAGTAALLPFLTPAAPAVRIAASAPAVDDEYSTLFGGDELDREVQRLSPPQPVQASGAEDGPSEYGLLYGSSPVPVTASGPPRTIASPPMPTGYASYVEELRGSSPGLVAAAERGGPPPRLFANGDYPTSTASGLDPQALVGLPWRARLAAAWEPTMASAHQIAERYADEYGEWMAASDLSRHPAVTDHVTAVHAWAATSGLQH